MAQYTEPKLNVVITDKQAQRLGELLPYGTRKAVFSCIIDDLISLLDKQGTIVLGALLNRALGLEDFLKLPEDVKLILRAREEEQSGHNKSKEWSTGDGTIGGFRIDSGSQTEEETN